MSDAFESKLCRDVESLKTERDILNQTLARVVEAARGYCGESLLIRSSESKVKLFSELALAEQLLKKGK